MANNRLYIRSKNTGNKFLLAKFLGWEWSNYSEGLEDWLEDQQLEDNSIVIGSNAIDLTHDLEIITEEQE